MNKKQKTIPVSLRSFQDECQYLNYQNTSRKVNLSEEESLKEWNYWRIIDNAFPYSYAFKTHHMLVPKRSVKEEDLIDIELKELAEIYIELNEIYDCRLVNFNKKQSIKDHFHVHLLIYKDCREDLES